MVCQTGLSFKLRCYKKAIPDPSKPNAWIYPKMIDYHPVGLEMEKDQSFIEGLDMFQRAFSVQRDEAWTVWQSLRDKMMPDDE